MFCSVILFFNSYTTAFADGFKWQDESCIFHQVSIGETPKALIEEFLHRDGEGEFLKQNTWLNVVFECPKEMSEPANIEVIKSYKILQTEIEHNDAFVTVQYENLGTLNSVGDHGELGDFKEDRLTAKMTFGLKKTPYGWRIKKNNIIPRVLLQNVLKNFLIINGFQVLKKVLKDS
jgi:hypothetical protein